MSKTLFALAVIGLTSTTPALSAEKSVDILGIDGKPIGTAELASGPHGTAITIQIGAGGLSGGWHGIHLHEVGDCSDIGEYKKSKGHINPGQTEHGLMNPNGAHPADLPNIGAHADGSVTAQIFAAGVSLGEGMTDLLDADGSALVIHEGPDDHLTQPIGGAGARVACAEIK